MLGILNIATIFLNWQEAKKNLLLSKSRLLSIASILKPSINPSSPVDVTHLNSFILATLKDIIRGKFGSKPLRLHLAQNVPNAPIYYTWTGKEPNPMKPEMFDDVLFNRRPPYAIPGGVKDALDATSGRVYGITDDEASEAKRLFEKSEDIDILKAPGVAVAALVKALQSGTIGHEDAILLNVTGGGISRLKEDFSLSAMKCDVSVSSAEEAAEFLEADSENPDIDYQRRPR